MTKRVKSHPLLSTKKIVRTDKVYTKEWKCISCEVRTMEPDRSNGTTARVVLYVCSKQCGDCKRAAEILLERKLGVHAMRSGRGVTGSFEYTLVEVADEATLPECVRTAGWDRTLPQLVVEGASYGGIRQLELLHGEKWPEGIQKAIDAKPSERTHYWKPCNDYGGLFDRLLGITHEPAVPPPPLPRNILEKLRKS